MKNQQQMYTPVDGDPWYVYILISETPSRFGGVIRYFTGTKYNHASIAFDASLKELYSFGRRQQRVPLNAGLVEEYPERFSLGKVDRVDVRIYRIPITFEQYLKGKRRIYEIQGDAEGYLYNLFSVLSFPLLHGLHTYKAYTCAEFVAHMLEHMGIQTDKRPHQYIPEEIGGLMPTDLFFEGNLLDYCDGCSPCHEYFFRRPDYLKATALSCYTIARLVYRKIRHLSARV